MKKNVFTFATASEIAKFDKQTQKNRSRSNKNFTEEEKKGFVPTQKNVARVKLSPLPIDNEKVAEFRKECLKSYNDRREHVFQTVIGHNSFDDDTNIFLMSIDKFSHIVYNDICTVARLTGQKNPDDLATAYAKTIAILDKRSPDYVGQKELNKLPELVSAIANGRKTKNQYILNFAKAMCFNYMTMNQFKLMYYGLNKGAKIDDKTRETLRKQGANNFTLDTASAQSCQVKKLCRAFGLIDYVKGKKNTPITVKDNALKLFGLIAGLDK